ncbi:MAG TPA: enoyl-CoA hydratase/isomerase family protein [Candidatus Binatia bacterium]|jgi:enoyl-CoA hydratase/carnithine racemase|nr:enoyl-CoA hydratase/isomerase family protein [Candidatus Binatia bacterium]
MVELTMTAPGKNALSAALMSDVLARVRAANGEPLLVTGAGDAFSAGLNLKEVAELDLDGMRHFLELLEAMVEALYEYPGPTVAAVNGHAIAGGCVVALCCDLRVATRAPQTRIGLNEVALGVQFPPKVLAMVRRRVPPRSLERVVLEAGLHDPESSIMLGLTDELADDCVAVARTRLERLAAHPRAGYVATKLALRGGALALTSAQERAFHDELVPSWVAPDAKERMRAVFVRK